MAELNPPLYLDQDGAYGAAELGLPFRDIMGEGVVGVDDLEVTAGTGLKSSVAAGAAWVKGDDDADKQPTYRVENDAAVLLQHDAADATHDRIDLVIAQVEDSTFSGVSKRWQLAPVKGTPAATPVAPDLPDNAVALAQVTIPAGSGTLGTITDLRTRAKVGAGAASVNAAAQTLVKVYDSAEDDTVTFPRASFDCDLTDHQDGTSLIIEYMLTSTSGTNDTGKLQINGDASNDYDTRFIHVNPSGAVSGGAASTVNGLQTGPASVVPPDGSGNAIRGSLRCENYTDPDYAPMFHGEYVTYVGGTCAGTTFGRALFTQAVTALKLFLGSGQIAHGRFVVFKRV